MNTIAFLIIAVTGLISYKGFNDSRFRDRLTFDVEKVLLYKQYKRLVTSGLIHTGWLHLTLNMITLLIFSSAIQGYLGVIKFLIIYIGSLVGGNLMALLIHRNHSDYSSLGASGAVNGVIFASIALFPSMGIGFFLLPVSIPSWLYGLLFVGISIYGIRSKRDHVGHEAHLGGALTGMLIALIMEPTAMMRNYIPILVVMLPTLGFLYFLVTRPHFLLIDNYKGSDRHFYSIDHKYNVSKAQQEKDIDRILDKIKQKGMKSLTAKEKALLHEYSKTIQ
jgi:membrane associated rhomboid family serine protease